MEKVFTALEKQYGLRKQGFNIIVDAYKPGKSSQEIQDLYNNWTDYERDLSPDRYLGPAFAAEAVLRWFPSEKTISIADVGAGSGYVGIQLKTRGYNNLTAIEGATKMLERAHSIYHDIIPCYIGPQSKECIKDDAFDCVVSSGVFGANHMPLTGVNELIRIVKPGGVVITVMREEYIHHEGYRDVFEPYLKELESKGYWKQLERSVVDNYFCDHTGLVLAHRICVEGYTDFESSVLTGQ